MGGSPNEGKLAKVGEKGSSPIEKDDRFGVDGGIASSRRVFAFFASRKSCGRVPASLGTLSEKDVETCVGGGDTFTACVVGRRELLIEEVEDVTSFFLPRLFLAGLPLRGVIVVGNTLSVLFEGVRLAEIFFFSLTEVEEDKSELLERGMV